MTNKYRLTIDSQNKELLTCLMHIIKKTDAEAYLYTIDPTFRPNILDAMAEIEEVIAYLDATGLHTKEENGQ